MIQAPTGCLLTESLAAILEDDGRQIVWLRFDWEDFDPATCLLSLIEAFQVLDENIGPATLENLRRRPGPFQGWSGLFSQLGNEIKSFQLESITVILENLHYLIRSPQTLALLGKYFLASLPARASVILITHQKLPRYSLSTPPTIVNARDLRLSSATIQRLFQDTDLLSEVDSIRQAIRLMDGRPVGLMGICQSVQLLGGAYVLNVLQQQTTQAGFLGQITRDWLNAMDDSDVQSTGTLLFLGYNNPSINQSQTGRPVLPPSPWAQQLEQGWIRPRNLWLSSIESALNTSNALRKGLIYPIADELCRNGCPTHGIKLLLASGDPTGAAQLLAQNVDELLSLGQWELLKAWLEVLPAAILAGQPRLLHASAEIKSAQGDLVGASHDFQHASERYLQQGDQTGHLSSLLALSTLAARQGDAGEAWSCADKALQLARSARLNRQASIAELQISLLALQARDVSDAIQHFELAEEQARIAGDVDLVKRIKDIHVLASEQAQLQHERQEQGQRYLTAQQAELHHLESLQGALQMPWEALDPIWSSQGWLQAPLVLKPQAASSFDGHPVNGKKSLLSKVTTWLRRALANSHHQKDDDFYSEGAKYFVDELPAQLEPDVAETPTPPFQVKVRTAPDVNHEPSLAGLTEANHQALVARPVTDSSQPNIATVTNPTLSIYMLGEFRLVFDDVFVEELPSGKLSLLFKYLIHNHRRRILRDELMDIFWPDVEPESARNRLNVTLSKIRKALRNITDLEIILFDADKYFINPELQIWVDVDQFEELQAEARRMEDNGKSEQAIKSLEVAANLYQGDFLEGDAYAEWTVLTREHLRLAYLEVLYQLSRHYFEIGQYAACTALCQNILARDNCREDAHCLLMRCYAHQGQVPLALRQFQICAQALRQELEVDPAASTVALYKKLRQREITQSRPAP